MKKPSRRARTWVVLAVLLSLVSLNSIAADDLRITPITHEGDCTTLVWASRPGETCTVYWTDQMKDQPFWRTAAVNVRSGGASTIWTEGECGQSQALVGGGSAQSESLYVSG